MHSSGYRLACCSPPRGRKGLGGVAAGTQNWGQAHAADALHAEQSRRCVSPASNSDCDSRKGSCPGCISIMVYVYLPAAAFRFSLGASAGSSFPGSSHYTMHAFLGPLRCTQPIDASPRRAARQAGSEGGVSSWHRLVGSQRAQCCSSRSP